MRDEIASEARVHWFVDGIAQQRGLDVIVRWLLACAPAVSVTDAREQTVLFAERMELPLEHGWLSLPFGAGWVLRVAEPIDVPAHLFEARVDEAIAYVRALFNGQRGGGPVASPSGASGPASAAAFADARSRRKD